MMQSPESVFMLQELVPIVGMVGGLTVTVVLGLPIVKMIVRRMERGERPLSAGGGADSSDTRARLERIEQAVEAVALEVERISEAQRFTTKLLSERTGHDKLGSGA